jgi:hypothetical protein
MVADDGVVDPAGAAGMQRAYCQSPVRTDSHPHSVANCTAHPQPGHGGGGGPRTGTVIGGSPGISTTVEPISGGRPGIAPAGGGGGGGGIPLEIWIVTIEPGTV